MRRTFADELYKLMEKNEDVWLVTGDLGYRMFDNIQDRFWNRFVNAGAAEQAMLGVGVGLAQMGKIPFIYSITPFLIYRPFETIRNYVNHEKAKVCLVGGGRDKDYDHDGFSHWACEDRKVMDVFENIPSYWPLTREEIPGIFNSILGADGLPAYINLRR